MDLAVPPPRFSVSRPAGIPGVIWDMREIGIIVIGAIFTDAVTGEHVGHYINNLVTGDPLAHGVHWAVAALALVPLTYGLIRGCVSIVLRAFSAAP